MSGQEIARLVGTIGLSVGLWHLAYNVYQHGLEPGGIARTAAILFMVWAGVSVMRGVADSPAFERR